MEPHDWSIIDCVVSLHERGYSQRLEMFRACALPAVCCSNVIAALKVATKLQDSEEKKMWREISQESGEGLAVAWRSFVEADSGRAMPCGEAEAVVRMLTSVTRCCVFRCKTMLRILSSISYENRVRRFFWRACLRLCNAEKVMGRSCFPSCGSPCFQDLPRLEEVGRENRQRHFAVAHSLL